MDARALCFVRSWMPYCWTTNTFIGRWWQVKKEWPPFHHYKAVLDYDLWPWEYGWNASAVLWCGHWTWDGCILYSWPLTLQCYLRLKDRYPSLSTSYPSFITSRKREREESYEMAQANPWKDASIAHTPAAWKLNRSIPLRAWWKPAFSGRFLMSNDGAGKAKAKPLQSGSFSSSNWRVKPIMYNLFLFLPQIFLHSAKDL